jgi:hypothetical protein
MPRVSDFVSDNVWRVPKPTSLRMSASMRAADGAVPMSYSSGWVAGGVTGVAALRAAGMKQADSPRTK